MTISQQQLVLLKLLNIQGLGPIRIRQIMESSDAWLELFERPATLIPKPIKLPEKIIHQIKTQPFLHDFENQLKLIEKYQIRLVSLLDDQYPELLRRIYDPPPLLFYRGNINLASQPPLIAIVGTRNPDTYGRDVTQRLARELIEHSAAVVVSGLADGIDAIAHQVTLAHQGKTIAVTGTGVDVVYPAEHKKLMEQIIKNGLVLSEFLPGSKINPTNFPRRNRIISGLSIATIVIQAGLKSGAMITGNCALNQNREVFAVPGPIFQTKNEGTNQLIKEGASPLTSIEDIFNAFPDYFSSATIEQTLELMTITAEEAQLVELLEKEDLSIHQLNQILPDIDLGQLYELLLSLELKGVIRQMPGLTYKLSSMSWRIDAP